jgi:hypothetical protein
MNKKAKLQGSTMNKKGQLQLEAIACFCAFLGLLAIMLHSVNNMNTEAQDAVAALKAKAATEFCCMGADALYSGNAKELLPAMPCSANENLVESSEGEKIKKTQCIAPLLKTVEREQGNRLEVTPNEHYR